MNRVLVWGLLMAVAGSCIVLRFSQGVSVQTDIRALLPASIDVQDGQWLDQIQAEFLQQSFLLIGHAKRADLSAAVAAARQALAAVGGLREIRLLPDALDPVPDVYRAHPAGLLSAQDAVQLGRATPAQIADAALARVISLGGMTSRTSLDEDPFGFLARYLDAMPAASPFVPNQDCLHRAVEGLDWCLLLLQSAQPGFGLAQARMTVQALDRAAAAARSVAPQAEILDAGVSRHADLAATRAKSEMSLISSGSLTGVLLLLWLVLRRATPFLLTLLVLAGGAILGLAAVVLAYRELHLIALVFGACLIGVAVDYALHFLAAPGTGAARWQRVAPGMRIGLMTTSLAFLSMLLAPYASLRQVALFAVFGLLGSYLTVRLVLSGVAPRYLGQVPVGWLLGVERFLAPTVGWRRPLILLLTGLTLLAGIGALRVHSSENVRAMHQGSPALLQRERSARMVLDGFDAAQLYLLRAPSPELLLRADEALDAALQAAVAAGQLERFQSLSQALPSVARQQVRHELVARKLLGSDGALALLAERLGLPGAWVAQQQLRVESAQPLEFAKWLESPASLPYRNLLREDRQQVRGLVRLGGVRDLDALSALADGLRRQGIDVRWHDPVAEASAALAQARVKASFTLCAAGLLVLGLLVWRYGPRRALILLAPTTLAILCVIGLLGWFGLSFTLFRLFALLLVAGLAIDYAVFLHEAADHRGASLLAILLSAGTTMLSFGLLSLSATPALDEFGTTVMLGVGVAVFVTLGLQRAGWLSAKMENAD